MMKSLIDLKLELNRCIDEIQAHLDSNGQDGPSFDRTSPPVFTLPDELEETRGRALDAVTDLGALLRGPLPQLLHTVTSQIFLHGALYSLGRLSIAQKLGEEEEVGFAELSRRCGIDATDSFLRVMRVAIAHRIFEERMPGYVRHNALSLSLVRVPIINKFISHCYEDMVPPQLRVPEALTKWSSVEDPRDTAFALAHGRNVSAFELINEDPARAQRFADAMVVLQSSPSSALAHVVDNFDWKTTKSPLIVDVGGSQGALCTALLSQNPDATGIVQDLADVVANATVPANLEGRLRFQAQDFFAPQQTIGADIYLFCWIFHDWPDTSVILILRNQVPALKRGARLVICETCLPEPGTVGVLENQRQRGMDLGMRVMFNGKERDEAEWRDVLTRADPRFVLESIKTPKRSLLSILEVAWTGF